MDSDQEARRQDDVVAALQRDLKAERYAARRAQKQYDATDPDNRLVADELERRWNEALLRVRELEQQVEQQTQQASARPARPEEMPNWPPSWRQCGSIRTPTRA